MHNNRSLFKIIMLEKTFSQLLCKVHLPDNKKKNEQTKKNILTGFKCDPSAGAQVILVSHCHCSGQTLRCYAHDTLPVVTWLAGWLAGIRIPTTEPATLMTEDKKQPQSQQERAGWEQRGAITCPKGNKQDRNRQWWRFKMTTWWLSPRREAGSEYRGDVLFVFYSIQNSAVILHMTLDWALIIDIHFEIWLWCFIGILPSGKLLTGFDIFIILAKNSGWSTVYIQPSISSCKQLRATKPQRYYKHSN